jgi:hypothetical protein
MAQKANLTPVDKYESDRREAERLDLEKHARLGPTCRTAGQLNTVSGYGRRYRSTSRVPVWLLQQPLQCLMPSYD